jgi:parallel beta-helix repeat protein
MTSVRYGVAAVAAVILAVAAWQPAASADLTCTRYAATNGSDSSSGTLQAPYRTVARLLSALGPGGTGCLRAGTFVENVAIRAGGAPGNPLTLTSAPGERATISGTLTIGRDANDVVVSELVLNGKNASWRASPLVTGDRVVLRRNEITNAHTAICVLLGPGFENASDRAVDPVVEGNRIHDCGRLPATGHDHGIYVEGTSNARIAHNLIYDNADYGIHLYPDADASYIANNVVDGNGGGLIFAGERAGGEYSGGHSSDNNVVENNIFSNNTRRNNIESWWGGPVGTGNVARLNCIWNGFPGNVDGSEGGFINVGNLIADPLYVNRGGKDFGLRDLSPCVGKAPIWPLPPPSPPPAPPPPPPAPPPSPPGPPPIGPSRTSSPPAVRIITRRAGATVRGYVAIGIASPGAATRPISGSLTLGAVVATRLLTPGRRFPRVTKLRLGSSKFVLGRPERRAVRVRLSSRAMKALRRIRRLRVRAGVLARDALGASRRASATIVVTAPRRARRR